MTKTRSGEHAASKNVKQKNEKQKKKLRHSNKKKKKMSLRETINQLLPTDECVEWKFAVNDGGYPIVWENGKNTYVHRIIAGAREGDVVLHTCDNPRCINKRHLVLGTAKENSQDMVRKGRSAYGERAGNSKLTERDVLDIREWRGLLPSRDVAAIYHISKTNVLDIWNRRIWKHL